MGETPSESLLGIVLAVTSLVAMPLVAWAKLRAAREIRSEVLRAEAKERLACVAALAMVSWLIREGREGFEDEQE